MLHGFVVTTVGGRAGDRRWASALGGSSPTKLCRHDAQMLSSVYKCGLRDTGVQAWLQRCIGRYVRTVS